MHIVHPPHISTDTHTRTDTRTHTHTDARTDTEVTSVSSLYLWSRENVWTSGVGYANVYVWSRLVDVSPCAFVFLQERDGMRSILESYESELPHTEHLPQLSKRLREAEDILHKTQHHHAEMEVWKTSSMGYFNAFVAFPSMHTANGEILFCGEKNFFF